MKTQRPASTEAQSLQERAAGGLEALSILAAERDTFRQRNESLEVDAALMAQHIEQLKARLETIEAARDHYMRYATELVTHLNDIQVLINEVVSKSATAAYRRDLVPLPTSSKLAAVTAEGLDHDTANLRSLISRLPKREEPDDHA
jgi:predicted transcriptional regulator